MPCVSREALSEERLGLLLGVPRQQVAPGCVAECAGQGPCGNPAATEGERVVDGATAERQVRGAVDPAHPYGMQGCWISSRFLLDGAEPVATPGSWARRRRRSSWASARWSRALSMESRLLRWVACSDFNLLHDQFIEAKEPWLENSTFAFWWQTIEDRALLCVEEVARARTSSHLLCHFDGFMVHRDVPPVTSPQQFLDDLATHLRITTRFTILFDLKEHFPFTQLLVHTAQQTHQMVPPAAQDDLDEGVVLGPCATVLGFTTGLWLAAACAERMGDWLAAVNDGVPANAVVMRPAIGFEIPKDVVLIVVQDPGVVCPCNQNIVVHS